MQIHGNPRLLTRLASLSVLALLLFFAPGPLKAESGASHFIDALGREALAAAADKSLTAPEKEKRFRKILRQKFALKGIAKFALGRYWRRANEAERKRYLTLFENYVVYTYLRNFNRYSGQTLQIVNERDDGKKGFVVAMKILNGNAPPFKLNWRLKKSKKTGQWRIVDIKIEGISMAVTQRTDFSAAIRGHNGKISPFLDDLKMKIEIAKAKANQKAVVN